MQPPVKRSTGERYEQLPSVLTYDYVSLFLNDERGHGTSPCELMQEGQSILLPSPESMPEHSLASWVFEHQMALIPGGEIHIRRVAEFFSQRGMQSVCVIRVTENQLRLGTMMVARKSVGRHPEVTIALAIPMPTFPLPR